LYGKRSLHWLCAQYAFGGKLCGLRKQNQVFTDMAALRYRNAALTGDQAPEQVIGRGVTPNFFDVLGVQPTVGRQFTAEEDAPSAKWWC